VRRRAGAIDHRLSASPLWAAQRRFYERAGVDAWRTSVVPHHVTSNVAIATAYARVVAGFLRDTEDGTPLYVVELGAGSGRFAFLFLRAIESLLAGRDARALRYVMTDVAERTMAAWRAHDGLAPFVRCGRLDFARFDADGDASLHLRRARRTIAAASPATRIVVIANYVFGGLRQDAWALRAGRIHEYLVTARGAQSTPANARLSWRVGARVTDPYPEAEFNEALREYQRTRCAGGFLYPVGALRCLERLSRLAPRALVLVADRGSVAAAEAVTTARDLEAARHGALSFPLSFHALRRWVIRRGRRSK